MDEVQLKNQHPAEHLGNPRQLHEHDASDSCVGFAICMACLRCNKPQAHIKGKD
jgi:hypothetical protein